MRVIFAYLAIIMIWSTTPLAIKWSSVELNFLYGLSFRMFTGLVFALLLTLIIYKRLPLDRISLKAYAVSSIGVFGAMLMVYWGAQFIPSGLISIIYGVSPMLTLLLAHFIFDQEQLHWHHFAGILLGFCGLWIIFGNDRLFDSHSLLGALSVLASVFLHAVSAAWLKHRPHNCSALQLTTGGLLVSCLLFGLLIVMFQPPLNSPIPLKTGLSILYLGIMGSVVGFVSYYYVLKHLPASSVALSTLITPVTALWLGYSFNNEPLGWTVISGTALILAGIVVHQFRVLFKSERSARKVAAKLSGI